MKIVRLARRAMATVFEVTLIGDDEPATRAAGEAALAEIARAERDISLFLPTSQISRINRAAGRAPVVVDRPVYRLLETAVELCERTGGAFDVTVGALMAARGLRGPTPLDAAAALDATGIDRLHLDGDAVRLEAEGMALDLGAIGKGWALDLAAAKLRSLGFERAFLHGGWSTLVALGSPPDASGWTVGLVDPSRPDVRLGSVRLADRALSVSAGEGRTAEGSGAVHIVDPRSGGEPRRRAAWAIAESATEADALSTAFVLQTRREIETLCRQHGVGAVLLDRDVESIAVAIERFREPRERPRLSRREFLSASATAAAAFAVGLPDLGAAQSAAGDDLRVAVVGVGEHGSLLLSEAARMDGVALRAVCDVRQPALDAALEVTGRNVETYLDHRHMLDVESLDAVIVATPTHQHAAVCVDLLEAGVSVFCEAPMAHSVEAARALARTAGQSGVVFQVGHQRRWSRLYPHALSHFTGGSIGELLRIQAEWNRRDSWRRLASDPETARQINWRLIRNQSGGLLLEQGSHVFDLASWYLGGRPERVAGFGSGREWEDWRDIHDTVEVLLVYPGDVHVGFSATLASSYGGERERLVGTAGTMLLLEESRGLLFKEADSVTAGWESFARHELLGDRRGIVLDPSATKYVADEPERVGSTAGAADFHAELAAFFDSVRTGEPPRCGAREGLVATVTALTALDAVVSGRVVEFTDQMFEV